MLNTEKEYLSFFLDGEEYCVNILDVREVRGWTKIRELPNAEPFLLGVLELRGEYIPIIDLRQRFSMPAAKLCQTSVVVIVNNDAKQSIGLLVDAVAEVYSLSETQIKQVPTYCRRDSTFIGGMANVADKQLVIIQLEKLFNFTLLHEVAQSDLISEG